MTTNDHQKEHSATELQVTKRALEILNEVDILNNRYLAALENGTMSREEFCVSQGQFYFAVTFFPRPMSALVGRIPDPRQRLNILHNVVEEHGEFAESQFHQTTFTNFLASLGIDTSEVAVESRIWPSVRAFNTVLVGSCLLAELEVGIACMGIIEQAFSGISLKIGTNVVKRGWVKPEALTHYTVHAEIDERHADEFFQVIENSWDKPERKHYIEQGLQLGAYIFNQLYESLYEGAQKQCKG